METQVLVGAREVARVMLVDIGAENFNKFVTHRAQKECSLPQYILKTLPKALRTQVLTALTSNFGLVGLVQYAW